MTAYTTRYFLAAICVFSVPTALDASEPPPPIVTISALQRTGSFCYGIAPHNQESVVAVTISHLQAGDSVVFDVINQSATNGKAWVSANATITSNSGWFPHPVEITGNEDQTAANVGQQLEIRARKNGTGGALALSAPFAVCAHPTNFRQWGAPTEPEDGFLQFKYLWDSDCDHNPDLNLVAVDEIVEYPSSSDPYVPPEAFQWNHPNPTVEPTTVLGGEGGTTADPAVDTNWHLWVDEDGPIGNYTGEQFFRFRCVRCNCYSTSNRDSLSWGDIMMGPIPIRREVFANPWRYVITKSGSEAEMLLADQ